MRDRTTETRGSGRVARTTLSIGLAALLYACSGESAAPEQTGAVTISPESIDFFTVAVGESMDLSFRVTADANNSDDVHGWIPQVFEACDVFHVIEGDGPFTLAPGATLTAVMRFSPTSAGSYWSYMHVSPNLGTLECSGWAPNN
ncbi:MAG: hypothetical protein KDA27_05245 [Candidatus Eisenbacteria bacterium]|uniref:EfeO-type cupredoxin-like domain-containing protein n=1 Tax=Eiseniibacteriota bacterium TaxID=2212470 RepID=A0A956NAG9_UNCEI|nr:hypothetical protein [Candidatus Eisenbacteria bacterium]